MNQGINDWQEHLGSTTLSGSAPAGRSPSLGVLGLTILAHPDPHRAGELAPLPRLLSGQSEPLSRLEPCFAPAHGGSPRPLADTHLSRRAVHLTRGDEGGVGLDCSRTKTRVSADGESVRGSRQLSRMEIEHGSILLLGNRVALVLHPMEPRPAEAPSFGLVGASAGMERVRQEIRRVADLPFPVLIRGESGTGKELVARALHVSGPRRDQPYLSVNLGAVPPSLAAAELFGAAKGAFTGADQSRPGFFQQADGGTLFLDEIGEAPPELQILLLRALETGEIQPVGATRTRTVDVRVIAATDVDLEAAVAVGDFRSPLLHRLASYEIELPPLRDRREDFGRLFFHFLKEELGTIGEAWRFVDPGPGARPWVPAELVARLAAWEWPGNVRQLRNVVRQLVVGSRGEDELRLTRNVDRLLGRAAPIRAAPATRSTDSKYRDPDDVGEAELLDALRDCRWNLKRAAAVLGVSRATLYTLIERCPRVRKASDLGRDEIERCRERCGGKLEAMVEALEVSKRGLQLRMKELGLARATLGQG